MAADALPTPTFLIIGAQKCGTRWLRTNLGLHPEVFTARRELAFFNRSDHAGLDAYAAGFAGWSGEPIVGEATPGYMMPRHHPAEVAARIDEMLPGVRVIAILRNPIDRAYSAFMHHMDRGRIPVQADLLARVADPPPDEDPLGLIAGGRYFACLSPYFERFDDRLRVFFLDDVSEHPQAVYSDALEHVGASLEYRPGRLDQVRYSLDVASLRSRYAREDGRRRRLSRHEREILWSYFEDDVERLDARLDRDLSGWSPSRVARSA